MTGHCAPSAIMMLAYDNCSTVCLVREKQKQVDIVPALSIITANGLTLFLAKPKKVQSLQVSTASPGTKCYQITFAIVMLL
jgi:hypothetical protein